MAESVHAETWLYSTLSGDKCTGGLNHTDSAIKGRFYAYVLPAGSGYPAIVYSNQGGHDVMGVGASRVMASMVYQVKVVGRGKRADFGGIKAYADRIDELLHGKRGVLTSGRVVSCVREQIISYVEHAGDDVYSHLGGLYRLQVSNL